MKVGTAVDQSSDKFQQAYRAHAGQLGSAGAWRGWGTGEVLASAEKAWSAFVRNLVAQVDAHGMSLSNAAKDYATTDRGAAARLAGSPNGHPTPGAAR
ncbi:hypothetical protein [Krasilnikovia cinnamomea]|uniref:hypothetical protein n=1 Tax=Krasilnikovia cinnamomea TaxID=349313 RepID=UPI00102BE594|nr:hypothetical protein [Krasilnikovia cinnamomea]